MSFHLELAVFQWLPDDRTDAIVTKGGTRDDSSAEKTGSVISVLRLAGYRAGCRRALVPLPARCVLIRQALGRDYGARFLRSGLAGVQ